MRRGIQPTLLRLLSLALALCVEGRGLSAEPVDPWRDLHRDVFASRDLLPAGRALQLYAPAQAADAALVPVAVHLAPDTARIVKSLTLVIDRNPAPVAAVLQFGDGYRTGPDVGERVIATRVRIDSFSKLRAVLETTDGRLFMAETFVAGAGGCSALPSKDAEEALANLGQMRIRSSPSTAHDPSWRETLVMVRHPNFTGLQMDKTTGTFTPSRFVDKLEIRQGNASLIAIEGGISLSENPQLRFVHAATDASPITVVGTDNAGTRFSGRSDDPDA